MDVHGRGTSAPSSRLMNAAPPAFAPPRGPHAYASVEIRMEHALARIQQARTAGRRTTVTHLVAKAAADALARFPDANVLKRGCRVYRRETVTVCVLVVQPEQAARVDLTTATVANADRLSLASFSEQLEAQVARVRARRDAVIERGKRRASRVPPLLLRPALRLLGFVWYTLNLDLAFLGMPRDPFGALTVTSVGSLGLERAYVPLVPYTRQCWMLAPGAVREEPVVTDAGEIRPGRCLTLTATFDARLISPQLAGALLGAVREALESPSA